MLTGQKVSESRKTTVPKRYDGSQGIRTPDLQIPPCLCPHERQASCSIACRRQESVGGGGDLTLLKQYLSTGFEYDTTTLRLVVFAIVDAQVGPNICVFIKA